MYCILYSRDNMLLIKFYTKGQLKLGLMEHAMVSIVYSLHYNPG